VFLVDLVYVCVVLKFTGKNIYLQKMRKKCALCKIFLISSSVRYTSSRILADTNLPIKILAFLLPNTNFKTYRNGLVTIHIINTK